MTWDDIMNCICQNAPSGLGVADVLRALERHTLCTGARCFEDGNDIFGAQPQRVEGDANGTGATFVMFMMALMAAATYLHMNRPTPQLADKPSRNGDDEPPAVQ
ncbi:hypothetical protein T492DRAFT_832804 [Pavlovales sp. CCMP2436]|nr:hypothetical protein T492DRAFT_832804 [Pavlovales sp. CCMP2436]